MKKIILIILAIIILIPIIWATWYTYNRQTKIAQAIQCQYEIEHPKPPTIMMAPDGTPVVLNSIVDPCMNFIVLPSLSDIFTGHIVVKGIPERMKVNPYSLMDMLLGRYTVGPNISLPCDQSATTTDCSKRPVVSEPLSTPEVEETASTSESVKIDEHLTINETLRNIDFCGKTYKTKQIYIDGINVIQRISELVAEGKLGGPEKESFCKIAKLARNVWLNKENKIEVSNMGTHSYLPDYLYTLSLEHPTMNIQHLGDFQVNIITQEILAVFQGYDGSTFKVLGKLRENITTNNISHYENQYIGVSLDYPSNLYADGQNDSFQVTFLAPDDPKRASSASMGALVFYLKEGQTIAEYIEKLKPITLSIKDSTVAGRSVKEITSTPDGYSGSTWIHILVETKRGTLQISFLKDTSRAQIYRSIIDSIRFND